MAEYLVTAPIYGCATITIEAESEEEAREKFETGDYSGSFEVDQFEVGTGGCRGNVCYRTEHDEVIVQKN